MAKIRHVNASEAGAAARDAAAAASTPSAAVVGAANKTVVVTDSTGRQIAIRRLSVLERMRFLRVLGKDSENQAYVAHAAIAACTRQIGEDMFPSLPMTIAQIEARMQMLDEHGIEAAGQALAEMLSPSELASDMMADAKN